MPSLLLTAASGVLVMSGNLISGRLTPLGGVQLRWISSGGNAYVAFSGGFTVGSGTLTGSGGCLSGMMDAFPLAPGDGFFVPQIALLERAGPVSGTFNLWATCDPAASGAGRLFFDLF